MDESALKKLLDSLESFRSSLDWWLSFWTALVVIGVVLEVVFVILEYREDLRDFTDVLDFRRGIVRPPEKPSFWLMVLGLFGAGLVAVGVSGELSIGAKIGSVETKIRKANDDRALLLSQEAGDAATSAERARKAADHAEDAAGKALVKSNDANTTALNAAGLADAARKETSNLTKEAAKLEGQLETVEAKRAELEKSLINLAVCNAPRVIPFWSIGNTKTAVDPLKPFAGRQAIIEFVPDAETRRAASNIVGSLEHAGWKIAKVSPADGIEDGVEVQAYFKRSSGQESIDEMVREWQIHIRSSDAVDILIDFLHSYNWQARSGWARPDANDIPPDGIKIRVGLYPAITYVAPPGAKDFAEAIAQFEQERETRRKQMEQQQLKREEEILKNLTPQQAIDFKARREQRNKEEKVWMDRYSGSPCQPLTPLSPSIR